MTLASFQNSNFINILSSPSPSRTPNPEPFGIYDNEFEQNGETVGVDKDKHIFRVCFVIFSSLVWLEVCVNQVLARGHTGRLQAGWGP